MAASTWGAPVAHSAGYHLLIVLVLIKQVDSINRSNPFGSRYRMKRKDNTMAGFGSAWLCFRGSSRLLYTHLTRSEVVEHDLRPGVRPETKRGGVGLPDAGTRVLRSHLFFHWQHSSAAETAAVDSPYGERRRSDTRQQGRQQRPVYGELIILGYNGCLPKGDDGRHKSKFTLERRPVANGVKVVGQRQCVRPTDKLH